MSDARMELADADEIELTLTLTLPVHAWRRVARGENWNPFGDVVRAAVKKVEALSTSVEVES